MAVDIPGEVRDLLSGAVEELKAEIEGARWVSPENLHLTMKFIGNYEEEKLDRLSREIHASAERSRRFSALLGGCGAFPSGRKARVIWVGMERGSEEAGRVARKLDSRLEKAGVKREDRPFRGHLTLGRLKQPRDCSRYLDRLSQGLKGLGNMPFEVERIVLYKSILNSRGPTYIPLERMELGGG